MVIQKCVFLIQLPPYFTFYKNTVLTQVVHFAKIYYYTNIQKPTLRSAYIAPNSNIFLSDTVPK